MVAQPLYRRTATQLEQMISDGCWEEGEQLPSEKELARRLGVSYMTLRRAVEGLEQGGRVTKIPGKGTFLRSSEPLNLQTKKTTVTLVLPQFWQRLDSHYFPDIVRGLYEEAEIAGVNPLVVDGASGTIPEKAPTAVLLIEKADEDILRHLKEKGHPVLAVNRCQSRLVVPKISPDNFGGAKRAVERLISLGHQRIAFLRGNPQNLDAQDRMNGYRQAMREAGLPLMEAGSGFSERKGRLAARELLQCAGRPTALVCASDLSAIGAMSYAREANLNVPADLSIIGFGMFDIRSYVSPLLTTVELPRTDLGKAICRALIVMAKGEKPANRILETPLVIGHTDAPPRVS